MKTVVIANVIVISMLGLTIMAPTIGIPLGGVIVYLSKRKAWLREMWHEYYRATIKPNKNI